MNYIDYLSTLITLIVVADDLTGAADCAARGFSAGLDAEIRLDAAPGRENTAAGVLALSSDTRHRGPAAAAAQVAQLVKTWHSAIPRAQWYKKIDSTLRGNIGAELDAILTALDTPGAQPMCALICPAFPAQRRGLFDGRLVFLNDPDRAPDNAILYVSHDEAAHHGEDTQSLADKLRAQSAYGVAQIALGQVREGSISLARHLSAEIQTGARLIVVDGISEADLAAIVQAAARIPHSLLCGSAGLITPLAKQLRATHAAPATSGVVKIPHGPIWMIVGSGSAMAHQQIEHARAAGVGCCNVLETMPDWSRASALILHLPTPAPNTPLEGDTARAVAGRLAQVVKAGLAHQMPSAVVTVGGDTAQTILPIFGLQRLSVLAEIQPGMPLVHDESSREKRNNRGGGGPFAVLKAGNHGSHSALVDLLAWLRRHQI